MLHGFVEGWLSETRRAPDFEVDIILAVKPVEKEDRGEVDAGEVPSRELTETVLSELLDPLCARRVVLLRIVLVGARRMTARHDGACESRWTYVNMMVALGPRTPSRVLLLGIAVSCI